MSGPFAPGGFVRSGERRATPEMRDGSRFPVRPSLFGGIVWV